ncbi:Flp family type IVb pilin [Devosia sp. Leaf420]|uniref:Flp family type IVb pilin n=1 Tax=Devosia sp. Leaf420 TaxID=1736374 RepID=UPI000AE017E3
MNMFILAQRLRADQSGATAIEYGLIGALISVVIVGALTALNGSMVDMYEYIRSYLVPVLSGS